MLGAAVVLSACLGAGAQQAGTMTVEGAPSLTLQECTVNDGCVETESQVVLDANWRWVHEVGGYKNCYKDSSWDRSLCSDPATCAQNCALEGVGLEQYKNTYGISAVNGGIQLKFVTRAQYGTNYGSRVYLMDGPDAYKMFQLKNREFTMDVDVSELPCGLNGAVYFVEMDQMGGLGGGNQAGARYGTGYCDAQCPHDIKFIEGEANVLDWDSKKMTPTGRYGICCAEMDIWEANSRATAFTPHPCNLDGPRKCEGLDCGDTDAGQRYDGLCDKDGCDFNSYRMGVKDFYGTGRNFDVDTTRPFSIVTQFITSDGTDEGDLVEIRRFYWQDRVIPNSNATVLSAEATDVVSDSFCASQKSFFGDTDDFTAKGGMRQMGEALGRGVVLVLSLWDDTQVNMLWLDSNYPKDRSPEEPGVARGPCPGGRTSTPRYVRSRYPNAAVRFTNIAVGEIGSTIALRRRLGSQKYV